MKVSVYGGKKLNLKKLGYWNMWTCAFVSTFPGGVPDVPWGQTEEAGPAAGNSPRAAHPGKVELMWRWRGSPVYAVPLCRAVGGLGLVTGESGSPVLSRCWKLQTPVNRAASCFCTW